jgi:YVTN family beta-propeller protein
MGVPLALCLVALACAAPAWADDVYVTNHVPLSLEQPSGTVSQFDVGAGGALAPKSPAAVAAGFRPRGVAVSPDGQSVYVTNNGEHAVSQYDVVAGGALAPKSPATVDTGLVPTGVAVSPDGQSVYVTTSWSSVFQYDVGGDGALTPKSPATVAAGPIPTGVAVSPDGLSVYVTNLLSNDVSQYDVGAGGALAPKSPQPTVRAVLAPIGVAVSPDGQSVYVTNFGTGVDDPEFRGFVSQYDVGAGGALAPKSPAFVEAAQGAEGIGVSPDGQSVYVAAGVVFQYDVGGDGALAPKSPATVAAGLIPTGVAVSPDGQSVYVTNQLSDDVSQFDVGAGGALSPKSSAAVAAGDQPFGIAVRPDVFPTIGELIDSVEALGLPRGIENGLVKKLENAQRNLDEGDTANACEKLASFIERVKAQSGKKIDVADADDLIADAEAIRAAEGCA